MSGVIVHEWIESHGGAENVVAEFAARFPDAPIVCAWDDTAGAFAPGRTHETWVGRTPLRRSKVAAMPALLAAWRRLALDADWLLCSSHLFAHHARIRGHDVPKFAFVHTPARYLWVPELDGRGSSRAAQIAAAPLKRIDRRRASEPTGVAAVSNYIARRIETTWGRETTVIYPPVNVAAFESSALEQLEFSTEDAAIIEKLPAQFVLGASRFVEYKRIDIAIKAGAAAGLPVVLAGDGPDRARLEHVAAQSNVPVTFLGRTSDALLRYLYQQASVFVFAAIEDFGIMPVEANAAGTPVIGRNIGGVAETIADGVSGVLVDSLDAGELRRAVESAMELSPQACIGQAQQFDGRSFGDRVADWMRSLGANVEPDDAARDGVRGTV